MTERWSPIPGYEGQYEASDQGRVWSLTRLVPGTGVRRGRLLSAYLNSSGYPQVKLTKDGRGVSVTVHLCVARAFLGPCPPGLEVCHNDGDRSNPRLGNLRYDTPSENARDTVRHGHNSQANKTHCKNGHPFTPENTAIRSRPGGGRNCLTCASRAFQKAKRAVLSLPPIPEEKA